MSGYTGQPLERSEDRRFLTGAGKFSADLSAPGQAVAVMVRSPHAHARIAAVNLAAARAAPGVIGAYSSTELLAAGVGPVPSYTRREPFQILNADGSEMVDPSQYPLATDRVRYVGEPVAIVVAETAEQARDAAELAEIDYRPLDAVTTADAALAEGAPQLWDDAPQNRSCHWEDGDADAVDKALAAAAHCIELQVDYPRVVIAYMEPRACLASYDPVSEKYLLEAGCQSAHRMRDILAEMLDIDRDALRVVVPDVGGGFGGRSNAYPEFACALFAARMTGRPVHWVCDRSEAFVSDTQARSQRIGATLGLDERGRITALRVASTWWHGAYLSTRSVYVLAHYMGALLAGNYHVPATHFSCRGVFTNTAPVAAYRGVARTEVIYMLERLMDEAARQIDVDRVDLRRRNLIAAEATARPTAGGTVYGAADFHRHLDLALEAIDWNDFPARRAGAASRGKLRGIGVTPFILSAGGVPDEFAEIVLHGSGDVSAHVGTQDFGMGHATVFSQIVADRFGIRPDQVKLVQGDTDLIETGAGGQGSRCMRLGGGAILLAADAVIEKALDMAGELLETDRNDIAFEAPDFVVRGTDRRISLAAVAARAEAGGETLRAHDIFVTSAPSFPNGCHACEVEIDPDTGRLSVERFVSVIDPGQVINPLIAEGQVHGGLAQAIGEAVTEQVVYDPASGQLSSGSFMDYALPRADDVPFFLFVSNPGPCDDNPLGVKGIGEAGTVGAQATIVNAALDALAERGVKGLDIPLTPARVWHALNEARA